MQSSKQSPRLRPLNWAPQSPLCVFIRNLKLLQLDLQPDWPDITTRSLSPLSQNQRQRIKAVEWALYHLVALWDPETAQDKLRPFFPPLEPLQSVNLRAALSRVLTDLKKNGDLGRETIFRKSMLDDCKGDKFDELLAVFSTAVLRKVLDSSVDGWPNSAIKLSMAKGITPSDYELIVPLILAHCGSLATIGERHHRAMDVHEQFAQLLADKKTQLERRSKENHHKELKEIGNIDALARMIKDNWMGSEEWADTLLFGGARSNNDAFLELPFEAAWAKANETTLEDLAIGAEPDLLVDLESRISHQKARLQKWREYSTAMQKKDSSAGHRASTQSKRTAPLLFRDHQALTVASISKAVRQAPARTSTKQRDQSLLRSLNEALSRIDGKSRSSKRVASLMRIPTAEVTIRNSPEIEQAEPIRAGSVHRLNPPPNNKAENAPEQHTVPLNNPVLHSSPDTDEPSKRDPRLSAVTLVERTRKSMSLLPPPTSRPREPRRSRTVRASFPANQFETPEKPTQMQTRASTPRDELFEETDYSSVFKSRPRVAHSPIASPAVHVTPLGEFDLEGDGESVADLEEMDFIASPSMRRRVK